MHRLLILVLAAGVGASAQTPAFNAVSIHSNVSGGGGSSIHITPGRVSMSNVTLRKVILNAYGIPDDREYALAGPDWLGADRFGINATFPPDTAGPAIREMLRTMLAERFQLALHRETRQLPMYSLVVAKGGPKIHASADGEGKTSARPGHFEASKITMRKFADLIGREAGHPVTDSTGLDGVFDFTLDWSASAGLRVESDDNASTAKDGHRSLQQSRSNWGSDSRASRGRLKFS